MNVEQQCDFYDGYFTFGNESRIVEAAEILFALFFLS